MNRDEIKEMILDIINTVDYDIYKSMLPELSEDPDHAVQKMETLIDIVEKYLSC